MTMASGLRLSVEHDKNENEFYIDLGEGMCLYRSGSFDLCRETHPGGGGGGGGGWYSDIFIHT